MAKFDDQKTSITHEGPSKIFRREENVYDNFASHSLPVNCMLEKVIVYGQDAEKATGLASFLKDKHSGVHITLFLPTDDTTPINCSGLRVVHGLPDYYDFSGAHMVFFSDTDNAENIINLRQMALDAKCLIYIANRPDLSNFTLPTTLDRGRLHLSLSSDGQAPSLVHALMRYLDEVLPNDLSDIPEYLADLRSSLLGRSDNLVEAILEREAEYQLGDLGLSKPIFQHIFTNYSLFDPWSTSCGAHLPAANDNTMIDCQGKDE